jgi:prepilin-type N-terminal cleavage/methylation domain-containing protein
MRRLRVNLQSYTDKYTVSYTQGYTLIELMIALALGLMLVLLAYGFAMNLNRSQIQARSSQVLQTQARYLFDILGYHLQAAGYYDPMRRTDAGSRYYLNYGAIAANSSSTNTDLNGFLNTLPTDKSKILPIQLVPTTGNRTALPASHYDPPMGDYITCDGIIIKDYEELHAVVNVFWVSNFQLKCRSLIQRERRSDNSVNSPWHLASGAAGEDVLIATGIADLTIKLAKETKTSTGVWNSYFEQAPATLSLDYGKSAKGILITLKLYDPNQETLTASNLNPSYWKTYQSFFQFKNRYN